MRSDGLEFERRSVLKGNRRHVIFDYIKVFYNRQRLSSAIKYARPVSLAP